MNPGTIHATAVVIGEAGVLIRGVSGAGKSALAVALIGEAVARGLFSRLVGDDRVSLAVAGERLSARPHPAIRGLLETRGIGIVTVDSEPAAVLRLVVDLGEPADRMPDLADQSVTIEGVKLPWMRISANQPVQDQACRIVDRLGLGRT
jgi:HPr kinase/phosphorylase